MIYDLFSGSDHWSGRTSRRKCASACIYQSKPWTADKQVSLVNQTTPSGPSANLYKVCQPLQLHIVWLLLLLSISDLSNTVLFASPILHLRISFLSTHRYKSLERKTTHIMNVDAPDVPDKHSIANRLLRKLPPSARGHIVAIIGELVGTISFLFFAFGGTQVANVSSNPNTGTTVITKVEQKNPAQLLYISLSFGFSLAANAWVFFRISGGLFNPAVSDCSRFSANCCTNYLTPTSI